jgi:hypothetical protein
MDEDRHPFLPTLVMRFFAVITHQPCGKVVEFCSFDTVLRQFLIFLKAHGHFQKLDRFLRFNHAPTHRHK